MSSYSTTTAAKRILIVDDQQTMAELWRMKFTQMGFFVQICNDGQEALSSLKKDLFDVILLDLYMPKKTGFEVLSEKGGTLNKDTPTYVITSSVRDEDIGHATQLGAKRAFLKYQTSPKDVLSAVKQELHMT